MGWMTDELSPEKGIDTCVRFFQLGQVQYTREAGGYSNKNYFVRTDQGEFLVKFVYNPRAHILKEIKYLDHLKRHGCAVSQYLVAPNGRYYWEDPQSGKRVVVQRKIPGCVPEQSVETSRRVGAYLARLHMVPVDYLPMTDSNLSKQYVQQSLAMVQTTFNADILAPLLTANERLATFPWEQLPRCVTHGDPTRHNCLFYEGRLMALVDWEEVGVNVALLDLAMCLLSCGYRYDEHTRIVLVPEWYNSLLVAYSQIRTLSLLEEQWLVDALWQAAVIISLWGLLQFGIYYPDQELLRDWLHPFLSISGK